MIELVIARQNFTEPLFVDRKPQRREKDKDRRWKAR
jgi:hypothetical protein